MGTLYLVRHGQASFGADNYDQLSPRGMAQAERLGQYWQEHGQSFDAVFTGTLHRHAQTLEGIARQLPGLPAATALPALNEYDSHALIRCIHTEPLEKPDTPERYRLHFRLLCDALAQWMSGVITPQGMPSWEAFSDGIHQALEQIRKQHAGGNVLLVSSGGPISTAVGQVLGTTPEACIALNMRLRNSAVTEFSISPKRLMLQTFNTLNHLDTPETRDWATFA
ncbi:histidine phosphatase family protein [Comamonas sp. GB3 AK4-5]|uniref:histidine phosphatase family protein n=1 Tax=Comamonas sp. GB3 AK4-5 TaxID=3231487 RepID=UPI00351E1CBE